jgi:hypothetical protein
MGSGSEKNSYGSTTLVPEIFLLTSSVFFFIQGGSPVVKPSTSLITKGLSITPLSKPAAAAAVTAGTSAAKIAAKVAAILPSGITITPVSKVPVPYPVFPNTNIFNLFFTG